MNTLRTIDGIGWYDGARKLIADKFGPDAARFTAILAATSPMRTVSDNWRVANEIYAAGRLLPRHGIWAAHKHNVKRALRGEPLSGQKVRAFYDNLVGRAHEVTIDRFMCRYLHFERESGRDSQPRVAQYRRLADRVRRIAFRYGITPADMQAIMWNIQREREHVNRVGTYQESVK